MSDYKPSNSRPDVHKAVTTWIGDMRKAWRETVRVMTQIADSIVYWEKNSDLYLRSLEHLAQIAPSTAAKGWPIPAYLGMQDAIGLSQEAGEDGSNYEQALADLMKGNLLARSCTLSLAACEDKAIRGLVSHSISALDRGEHALCCAGLFCAIEHLYTTIHPNGRRSGYTRKNLRDLIARAEGHGYESFMRMPSWVAMRYLAVRFSIYSIEALFVDDHRYGGYLARNRLLHGADVAHASRMDCIRLIICIANMPDVRDGLRAIEEMTSDNLTAEERTRTARERFAASLERSRIARENKREAISHPDDGCRIASTGDGTMP